MQPLVLFTVVDYSITMISPGFIHGTQVAFTMGGPENLPHEAIDRPIEFPGTQEISWNNWKPEM
jgi:hypothetical protein